MCLMFLVYVLNFCKASDSFRPLLAYGLFQIYKIIFLEKYTVLCQQMLFHFIVCDMSTTAFENNW